MAVTATKAQGPVPGDLLDSLLTPFHSDNLHGTLEHLFSYALGDNGTRG